MNAIEKKYFEALSKDREDSVRILAKPSMRGIWRSVIDKYADQAHFIYELLQNADDTKATSARFILEKNRLIFAHNGSKHFSLSDPINEDTDSKHKTLGDINAITSVANSNKTAASIGKFGIGFKAVFKYTQTPHVYDPNFQFKIERRIVPILLTEDFSDRKADETLFVFPFDCPEISAEKAYSDISDKLRKLSFPLLFMTNLKGIEFKFSNVLGLYGKQIKETIKLDGTVAEHLILTQKAGDGLYKGLYKEELWLFSRLDECERRYSVGFFMDENGLLKPVQKPAFCFFPTKEVTNLNFILHAPFLLTDSRESILAGNEHNDRMIQSLADLAADSMEYLKDIGVKNSKRLIDDKIVDIIPVDKDNFSDPADKSKVSFLPFYESIKNKFENSELIPTADGYVKPENAYWAEVPKLAQLFTNVQLAEITGNESAEWAFVSLARRDGVQRNNKVLFSYIDDLIKTNLNEDAIINGRTKTSGYDRYSGWTKPLESVKGITGTFIENQEISWLHEFYKWLSETSHRTAIGAYRPVFLDQNGKAVAAFDASENHILFLPVKDVEGYKFVNEELLKNEETKKFLTEKIRIKEPSLTDRIYNKILPLYKQNSDVDTKAHFRIFFDHYCNGSQNEVSKMMSALQNIDFLTCYTSENPEFQRGKASSMYFPTKDLTAYFETKKDTKFLAYNKYLELAGQESEEKLKEFFRKLGVKKEISITTREIDYYNSERRSELPREYSSRNEHSWKESVIDGCEEILNFILDNGDESKSVILWNSLLKIIESRTNQWRSLDDVLRGTYEYFYRFINTKYFPALIAKDLKQSAWIKNKAGHFVSPSELYSDEISAIYDTASVYAKQLLDFLGIKKEEDDSNLTESQKENIAFAKKLKECGITTEEDLEEFQEFKRQKEAKKRSAEQNQGKHINANSFVNDSFDEDSENSFGENEEENDTTVEAYPSKRVSRKDVVKIIKEVAQKTKEKQSDPKTENADDDTDEDEFMPSAVDYSKKTELAKQKYAAEMSRIAYDEKLQNKASSSVKYSYGWFKTLLEMESINSSETNSESREVSINFAKAEREPGTKRTLVLKHPNRYIPQFMEDLADIPLVFHIGDTTKNIIIEVANIKSYTLRVKLKNSEAIDDIDLSTVTSATIDAKSPAFLLEELRKQFAEFEFSDNFNMQGNLCENIEFVFGPPGTGKTTHLARNVILPIMQENAECKVLVLTPTNKSADVLVKRIMEVSGSDTSYTEWLVRFGATGDEEIEQSPVFRDKTFDIQTLSKNVTVTTIARFPYDFFMPEGKRVFLNGINWDYIIIDEASMIPLANIVYPLYKKTPKKFIIAGDPFQIEPITSIDIWKNENIYTMVELKNFKNPETKPHKYEVKALTTQYRSVPAIGEIFSKFAYDGILKHHRSADNQKQLNIGNELGIETLNIIKYPVSKYESIYRAKRLQNSSSYQVYSALFTFEYVSALAQEIAKNNSGKTFKIGIVAPYRAQADMIDKLLASENLPEEVDVQVGTIHGFQGDECDIIFAVFNTPPTISNSKEMFLNKKNIINVSISRARDYLFVVMPDDATENIDNLTLVKRVENLMKSESCFSEKLTPDLEEFMFGNSTYLEENSFSTGHQSVNVYGLPEKIYEIRCEDNALDVQIHRGN